MEPSNSYEVPVSPAIDVKPFINQELIMAFNNSTPNCAIEGTQFRNNSIIVPAISEANLNQQNFQNLVLAKFDEVNKQLAEIKKNQEVLLEKFTTFETEYNSEEHTADNKVNRNWLLQETKDEMDEEIPGLFPLKTMADLVDIEIRLQKPTFATTVVVFFKKILATQTLEHTFRSIINDNLTINFNLDGRCGKRKLIALELFNSVLLKSLGAENSRKAYESDLRVCILRAHNRHNRAKCSANKKYMASLRNATNK